MRTTMSPLYQLLHSKQLGVIDEMADDSMRRRKAEVKTLGVGHVIVAVDPAGTVGAYRATITTPAGVADLPFDPDSQAARLLHSVGVTKIPPRETVSRYIPLDVAVELARLAERPA